jgi:HK97 family phage major capsid protein
VSSADASAGWAAKEVEAADDSPTLSQPAVPAYKGAAFVPYSIEIEGGGAGFVTEVSRVLIGATMQVQNTAYVTGSGAGQPTGFISALADTASLVNSAGADVLAFGDVHALRNSLAPRFQDNRQWAANRACARRAAAGVVALVRLNDRGPELSATVVEQRVASSRRGAS